VVQNYLAEHIGEKTWISFNTNQLEQIFEMKTDYLWPDIL
jgi:hypothetical protein